MTGRRSYLLWAALLAGPALVLALLGFRAVDRADTIRRREAQDAAGAAATDAMRAAAARLTETARREDARPYYEFQGRYMPAGVQGVGPAFVSNGFVAARAAPGEPAWWFRYVLAQGKVSGPEILPSGPGVPGPKSPEVLAYDATLRAKLLAASRADWSNARVTPVPLDVVAANEEVGQLLEEVDVAQSEGRQTAYLEGFQSRVQNARGGARPAPAPIGVRSLSPRFLASPQLAAPPLVLWKVFWVPGDDAKEQRDAPVDRWILVGCAFPDPIGAPASTGGDTPPPPGAPRFEVGGTVAGRTAGRSLGQYLEVEGADLAVDHLGVVGIPDEAAVARARQDDFESHLWTSPGLLSVVGIGLFVLFRAVRRESDVARRKQDFVAAVTHELKTPLAGIRMYADMLKEGWVPEGESSASYAERIVDETKRLSGLVDQVLDFAAFERGVASFSPVPGDLGRAVSEAAELCRPAADEAGVALRVEPATGHPSVSFDGSLVRSLVVNLVDNAIKYSARAPTKEVAIRVEPAPGEVVVSVADRGVGIPKADRERVFEPFFRSGDELTRTAKGVGIGLALVARYARAHGARIELESEVGQGTTVRVRFPAPS
jgi:signal transduction histidine kinase